MQQTVCNHVLSLCWGSRCMMGHLAMFSRMIWGPNTGRIMEAMVGVE